ncbi:MAG: sugar phosphate nucleotidyltransferase [Candidatus Thorarchaeota archaeon]
MAAGNSTRMLPLSANKPKHLLPVAGQPFIFHTLRALREAGVTETLVIYGYKGEELQKAIDARDWGRMSISYVLQSERKGTAHAAGYAREFAGSDDILLMNGDVLTGPDTFKGLIENSKKNRFDLTLTVFPIEDPSVYGVVEVEDGKATELIEKPRTDQMVSNLVNAGIYAVGQDLWDAIDKTKPSKRGELEITDSIKMLIDENKVGAYTIPSWWLEIGKPWDLLEANKTILSNAMRKIEGTVEEGAVIKGNTIVTCLRWRRSCYWSQLLYSCIYRSGTKSEDWKCRREDWKCRRGQEQHNHGRDQYRTPLICWRLNHWA